MEENKSLPDKVNATKKLNNKEKSKTKLKITDLINFLLKYLNFPETITVSSKDYRKVKPFLLKNKFWFDNEIQNFIIHSQKKYVSIQCNKLVIIKYFIICISYFFSCLNIECETSREKNDLMYKIYKRIQLLSFTLVKLYSDNFVTIEDLLFFAKYLAMLSLADHSKNIIPNNHIKHFFFLKCSVEIIQNVVYNEEKIIQNFLYNEEIEKSLDEYLSFLLTKIIKHNPSNLYLLYQNDDKNKNLFSFLNIFKFISTEKLYEKTKNILSKFFSEIYQYHFSYNGIMAPCLDYMKQILINIEKKTFSDIFYDVSLADFPITYLNSIFEKEQTEKKKHPIILDNGLYISGNKSPLILTGLYLNSSYTLIFSFNLVPLFNENKQYYQILSICEKNGANVFLKIFLERINNSTKYLLKIKRHIKGTKETTITNADTQVEIEPYYTYIFSISGNKKEKKIRLNFLYKDKVEERIIELPKYPFIESQENIMQIGCGISNNKILQSEFDGFLGTIMFFETEIKLQYLENLLLLRGMYDNYAYFNDNCDISYLQKYTGKSENVHLFSNLQDYFFTEKENKEIFEKLKFIFTSKVFQFNETINEIGHYDLKEIKENFYEKNDGLFDIVLSHRDTIRNSQTVKSGSSNQDNNDLYNSNDFTSKKINIHGIKENLKNNQIEIESNKILNKEFFVFSHKPSVSEFLKFDGISFISLQFEYYFQVLSHLQDIYYNDFWIDIILKM